MVAQTITRGVDRIGMRFSQDEFVMVAASLTLDGPAVTGTGLAAALENDCEQNDAEVTHRVA
jgi:hypothetical protein